MEYVAQDDIHDLAQVSDPGLLGTLARLLSVTNDDLEKALTHRVIAAGGNVLDKGLTVSEAYYARDAFTKVSKDTGHFKGTPCGLVVWHTKTRNIRKPLLISCQHSWGIKN